MVKQNHWGCVVIVAGGKPAPAANSGRFFEKKTVDVLGTTVPVFGCINTPLSLSHWHMFVLRLQVTPRTRHGASYIVYAT
jgi:hypothetical protein